MVFNEIHPLVRDYDDDMLERKISELKSKNGNLKKLLEKLFHYFEDDPDLPNCDYFLEKIINALEEN